MSFSAFLVRLLTDVFLVCESVNRCVFVVFVVCESEVFVVVVFVFVNMLALLLLCL